MAAAVEDCTPLTSITRLFRDQSKPPLEINIDQLTIELVPYLDPEKCDSARHNEIIKQINSEELRNSAHKRIRLKSILSRYHKRWQAIRVPNFNMIQEWNDQDFALSILVYLIQHPPEAKGSPAKQKSVFKTIWRFQGHLINYFEKREFNGEMFVQEYCQTDEVKGFGLNLVKAVCKEFTLKSGPYTKVKKQLTAWGKAHVERYHEESKFSLDDLKTEEAEVFMAQNDAPIISNLDNNSGPKSKDVKPSSPKDDRAKWYWLNMNELKWYPYRDEHQFVIQTAWNENAPSVTIMDKFRIDFKRDAAIPTGEQKNKNIHDPWHRPVTRQAPDYTTDVKGMINGMYYSKHPM